MPTIAYFLGIAARMYYNDHEPPHVHIRYQGYHARVRLSDGQVIGGKLPPTVARLVREWVMLRREALARNWLAARGDGAIRRIEGLE
jgi:hypothetical protein